MGRYEALLLWFCLLWLRPFLVCGEALLGGGRVEGEEEGAARAGCWMSRNWVGVLGLSRPCHPPPQPREPCRSCSDCGCRTRRL